MKTAFLSIVFLLVSHWLVGQAFSSIFWQKALGGSSTEVANSIVRTTDGGTQVEYRAEKGIELKPGFRADSGAVFTAYIGGCQ